MEWLTPFKDNTGLSLLVITMFGIYNILHLLIKKDLISFGLSGSGKINVVNSINISNEIYSRLKEICAEYNVDKIYIVEYNKEKTYWSMTYEYSPINIKNVHRDYQKVPNRGFTKIITNKLMLYPRVIFNSLKEIKNKDKRNQLSYIKLNSWYCFALNGGSDFDLIGSLNLCFVRENPLNDGQIASLAGKISTLQYLITK